MGVKGGWRERLKEIGEILSTATSTQISKHNTNNNKKKALKQLSKEAIGQGKLREITKCLLTRFS